MGDSYRLQGTSEDESHEIYIPHSTEEDSNTPVNLEVSELPARGDPIVAPTKENGRSLDESGKHLYYNQTEKLSNHMREFETLNRDPPLQEPLIHDTLIKQFPVRDSSISSSPLQSSSPRSSLLHVSPSQPKRLLSHGYPDTDSCLSVSPSPDPDSKKKTFDFSMIDTGTDGSNLSAALQMEQEFLDFMFSLPQIQKEAKVKEQQQLKRGSVGPRQTQRAQEETTEKSKSEKRLVGNASRAGLDHLDNLCRMMEQLGELKEQNTRLQRRVHYLEELKALQEMHRDVEDSIAARKSALSLGSLSLSDSDLRLEDLNKSCAYLLDSEESLDQSISSGAKTKGQVLELPNSSIHLQLHSSSEDDRRPKVDSDRVPDKDKKIHKTAWGKVKNMINYNSKREGIRKKSGRGVDGSGKGPPLTKSFSVTSTKITQPPVVEEAGISDPEEYDLEYESMDQDGTSWEWEADVETGIWMGPKSAQNSDSLETSNTDASAFTSAENFPSVPKKKPQLTITLPSGENIHQNVGVNQRLSADFKAYGLPLSKGENKRNSDICMTPPSPRRSSNWSKVKQAFLTTQAPTNQDLTLQQDHSQLRNFHSDPHSQIPSHPISAHYPILSSASHTRKKPLETNFSFDGGGQEESDSPSGISPEISPDDLILQCHQKSSKPDPRPGLGTSGRHGSLPSSVVHKNLIELQKTLTGEFSKKLQEWEKFRGQGVYSGGIEGGRDSGYSSKINFNHSGENLPHEFRKKLHEWEKMKNRDKDKHGRSSEGARYVGHSNPSSHHLLPLHQHHQNSMVQGDLKTKKHDENDLPPDFKKKLTEWEIRKALVGKGQQNVEKLQKNLGEEFNKKLAQWEKMKALGLQAKINPQSGPDSTGLTQLSSRETPPTSPDRSHSMLDGSGTTSESATVIGIREPQPVRIGARISPFTSGTGVILPQSSLDRKGSAHKVKKNKTPKTEKTQLIKPEGGQKNRDKELLWLEKELNKIDREKQRLEREKEKFLEREARLEKMRYAMRQGPAEKREIYIKTSTGEFRFEGISQTFTKKLYEWEERRGIRPESSTFVLLDPNYKAPIRQEQNASTHQSHETKRITRSRSESSLAEIAQPGPNSAIISHQSSLSLSEEKEDTPPIQADTTSTKLTLGQDDFSEGSKCTIHAPIEGLPVAETEFIEEGGENSPDLVPAKGDGKTCKGSINYQDPYAPLEITRLIDSSGSEETLSQRQHHIEAECPGTADRRVVSAQQGFETETDKLLDTNSQMSEENYRSLLHENMTLLGKLKEQENLCRALETQMGDIDSKMDNVADQHLKTLEKLHRQVTMMQHSESLSRTGQPQVEGDSSEEVVEVETNERLIEQLKARIVELEIKGEKLMAEKEELECAFKLHKDHETQIAESLLIRIRELQDAGAEVNIQTVQCQTDEALNPEESHENSDESKVWKDEKGSVVPLPTNSSQTISTTKKKRRKRRDDYSKPTDDEAYDEDKEESDDEIRKSDKEGKEQQKRKKKVPPKKVQKLHNLTADLLFQAKRLEGALVTKHHLPIPSRESGDGSPPKLLPKRSLRGRSSLRLSKDEAKGGGQRKLPKGTGPSRTWSSIEAIVCPEEAPKAEDCLPWENRAAALATESQDLLAMNAELSRMARELRKEMMSVWSFRESTSTDSNSSEGGDDTLKTTLALPAAEKQAMTPSSMQPEQREHWLDAEATVVFHNISSLQPLDSEDSNKNAVSESAEISDSETGYKTPSPTFKMEGKIEPSRSFDEPIDDYIDQPIVESEEHFLSWWDVPFPKKRKESSKPTAQEQPQEVKIEEIYPDNVESQDSVDFEIVLPGCSKTRLVDLLHNNEEEELNEENETLRSFRLSPYYNITSPRESRVSRASSTTSEEERKDPFDGSAFETLKTNASSTFKSDVLSSSFEYENIEKSTDCDHLPQRSAANGVDSLHLEYPPSKKSAFTPSQLHKVGQIIEETVLTMEGVKKRVQEVKGEEREEFHHGCDLDPSKYETEVTAKVTQEDRGLRTRRVSDTQVEYEAPTQNKCSVHLGDFHQRTSPQSRRTVVRAPSVRRNQSESDVSWLHCDVNPCSQHQNKETPPDVFVTTHRTIFTISGEENSLPTRVIPTFLQDDSNGQHPSPSGAYHQGSSSNLSENSTLSKGESSSYSPDTVEDGKPLIVSLTDFPYAGMPYEDGEEEYASQGIKETRNSPRPSLYPTTFLDLLSYPNHAPNQPLESRRMVLEAANEANPTVKTMIDLYNKRITEKQELLINPFKPGDPFTENKGKGASIENISRNPTIKAKNDNKNDRRKSDSKVNISKSQSASILQNHSMIDNFWLRKSTSGTSQPKGENQILEPLSAPIKFFGAVSIPFTLNEHSQRPYYSKLEVPFELDVSTEDSIGTFNDYSSSQFPREKDAEKTRAVKLREAKEEFLARGSTPSTNRKRLSHEFSFTDFPDPTKANRGSSVTSFSSTSESLDSQNSSFRRAEGRQASVRPKDSFRRQSESVIACEDTGIQKNVVKSASSGFIELRKKPPQGLPPSNREYRRSCHEASDTKRNSKGIFKIFKLSRGKERKDLSAVQKLCQQSLDFASTGNSSTPSKSSDSHLPSVPHRVTESSKPCKPYTSEASRMIESSKPSDSQRPIEPNRPTELQSTASSREAATPPGSQENSRCSRTLPRELQANSAEGAGSSSVSCPSSPVALRKSRTAQWLAKGKKIFKSRSPSPHKRPR